MAFFDELSRKLSDAGQNVSQQTKNLGDLARLSSLISDRKKKLSTQCFELGKAYYKAHQHDENPEFPELVASITALFAEIGQAEDSVRQIKGLKKCPNCGADIPVKSVFCPSCGTQIGTPQRLCPGCGREAAEGTSFCIFCGARLG